MTIYKKNDKYYCRFKIHGEQKHLLCQGARSLSEAQAIEDAEKFKLRQQQAGLLKKENKITISQLLKLYEEHNKINNKDVTHCQSKIDNINNFFGKSTLAVTIKKNNIEDYRTYLRDERKLKSATVNKYVSVLRKAFNLGIENELIDKNPCKGVKKLKENSDIAECLSIEDEIKLFKVLPDYLKPIVMVALQTGLRRSNVLNLRWEQIDLDYGFIEIEKQENKGHKEIRIPISNKLRAVLESLPQDNEYVFVNPETKRPYNTIRKSWNTALKKANIKNLRFHDLRHTVATRLVANGVDIMTVKDILAHSSITTTQRYFHSKSKAKIAAVNLL